MAPRVGKGAFALNDVKEFKTVRITFRKVGRARYISHLDLNRTMTRAVRRAALPIWYTEGFNRHPYITFASPLSLGYEGERELMDVRLQENMDLIELVERLNAVMPEGLQVIDAAWAVKKAGEIDRAVYRLTLPCPSQTVRSLFEAPSILVQKRTKKKELKTVDIKAAIEASNATVIDTEEGCAVELTLPCNSTDTVNPSLVVSALKTAAGGEELSCRVKRLAILDSNGEYFA